MDWQSFAINDDNDGLTTMMMKMSKEHYFEVKIYHIIGKNGNNFLAWPTLLWSSETS